VFTKISSWPICFHVHFFFIILRYLLAFHFCRCNFINFVILLASMALSKMRSLGMSDDDNDGGKLLMQNLIVRTWRIVVVHGW